jgi:hypothetical protein
MRNGLLVAGRPGSSPVFVPAIFPFDRVLAPALLLTNERETVVIGELVRRADERLDRLSTFVEHTEREVLVSRVVSHKSPDLAGVVAVPRIQVSPHPVAHRTLPIKELIGSHVAPFWRRRQLSVSSGRF